MACSGGIRGHGRWRGSFSPSGKTAGAWGRRVSTTRGCSSCSCRRRRPGGLRATQRSRRRGRATVAGGNAGSRWQRRAGLALRGWRPWELLLLSKQRRRTCRRGGSERKGEVKDRASAQAPGSACARVRGEMSMGVGIGKEEWQRWSKTRNGGRDALAGGRGERAPGGIGG